MKLFNTLSRTKEELKPIGKVVKIYSCGPTVYSTPHIGNLRAYIFTDVLKKTLELNGYEILDVMNLTDVGHLVSDADDGEDKVEKSARAQGTTPQEIARMYTEQFFEYCARLNIRKPQIIAPATKYIDDMIDFIKGLEKKGYTYLTSDGVYFDSSKVPEYNKLSRTPIDKNRAGERVSMGEKRNPHDFALWKFVNPNAMQKWESPWGVGCVGWHIECSAIARKELGDTFDIHTGGVDHIQIHHTNEIAQTESLTGKPMCNFWCHNEHIKIDDGKMSKSLGNVYTVDDIEKRGINPLAYRYMCLLTHYRSQLNFTWDALQASQNAYDNLIALLAKHRKAKMDTHTPYQIKEFLFDDLNTPQALAKVWELVKQPPDRANYDAVIELDKVFGLGLDIAVVRYLTPKTFPATVVALANHRMDAKKNKDFKLADELRQQIIDMGYEIKDTKDGFELK